MRERGEVSVWNFKTGVRLLGVFKPPPPPPHHTHILILSVYLHPPVLLQLELG